MKARIAAGMRLRSATTLVMASSAGPTRAKDIKLGIADTWNSTYGSALNEADSAAAVAAAPAWKVRVVRPRSICQASAADPSGKSSDPATA